MFSFSNCFENSSAQMYFKLIDECNFEKRLEMCTNVELKDAENNKPSIFSLYELNDQLKQAQYVMMILTFPIICSLSFFLNLLNILIVKSKKNRKEMKEDMFEYIFISSLVNCLYSFISMFQMLSICVQYGGEYCSSVRLDRVVQYFKIVFTDYIGSSVKLTSNISLIAFSLDRYILISDDKRAFFVWFRSIRPLKFMSLAFLASLALSVPKCFQYKVEKEDYSFSREFPVLDFIKDENYYYNSLYNYKRTPSIVYNTFWLLQYTANFVTTLIHVSFDIYLLAFVREKMRKKRAKLLENEISPNEKAKLVKINDTNIKMTLMVVLNSSLIVLFRLPEIFFSTFYVTNSVYSVVVYQREQRPFLFQICNLIDGFCEIFLELADYFYVFSFSVGFFIYFIFNKKFRKGFARMLNINKKKLKDKETKAKECNNAIQYNIEKIFF